jgi:hypothetical protein
VIRTSPKLILEIAFVFTLIAATARCQSIPGGQQKSEYSNCSNIIALAGDVNINCSTLTPEQKRILERIPAILNKILKSQNDEKAMMDKLDEILRILSDQANPYKPVVTYEPNGFKRTQSPGNFEGDDSLIAVSKEFDSLQAARDWNGIILLTERTRQTDPGWFSLDMFSGVAKANLCQPLEARAFFEKFITESAGAPNYGDARQQVEHLRDALGSSSYAGLCANSH